MNAWHLEGNKPGIYQSIIVFGILDGEPEPDSHEGFWTGHRWKSVREYNPEIHNVTHWMFFPKP